jgi:hypothetical protein
MRGLCRLTPPYYFSFDAPVRDQALPHVVAPLAKKRNNVRADVIFAKDL